MSDLLCSRPHQVAKFVDQTVLPALADGSERSTALKPLLKQMAALSLFGLNIPRQFGGLEETPEQIARTMEELSRGWMCLPSVLGSHMRAAPYILDQGTQEQKEQWLPALASGAQIWAHGYSERRLSATGRLSTEIFESQGHYILSTARKTGSLTPPTRIVFWWWLDTRERLWRR